MTRILRIEDDRGIGLYGVGAYSESLAAKLYYYFPMEGCDKQPPPGKDGMDRADDNTQMYYGFLSAHQMMDWLNGCTIDELYKEGGRVIVIDVKDVDCGYKQCRYKPNDVIRRKPIKLHELKERYLSERLRRDSN